MSNPQPKALPNNPNIEQLKKQAKELHHALEQRNPEAMERLKSCIPTLYEKVSGNPTVKISLNDAFFILAREYGAPSWERLKHYIEIKQDPIASFIKAVFEGNHIAAKKIHDEYAVILHDNLITSVILGDADKVCRHIKDHPEWVKQPMQLLQVEPLFYVCFSTFHQHDENSKQGIIKIVKELLANGANPNAFYIKQKENWKLTALYGACGIANNPNVARLLLEAGANPNDNESLYHSTEHSDNECLKLLIEFKANPQKTNALPHVLDYDNIEGVRLLLAAGANPNERLGCHENALHWAVKRGRSPETLALLLKYDVELEAQNSVGFTPYQYAMHLGHTKAADYLATVGAKTDLSASVKFIAACMSADKDTVDHLLKEQPNLVQSLSPMEMRAVSDAAWKCKPDALQIMLDAGFDLNARGEHGATALHWACWFGLHDMVKMILPYNPPLEAVCQSFGCTPFNWACHGSVNCRNPVGNYVAVLKLLIDAGAEIKYLNKWGESNFPYENEEVADFLRNIKSI